MMRTFLRSTLLFAIAVLLAPGLASNAAATPKKILLVTVTMEFHHTSTVSAEKIIPMLGEKGGWTVDIVKSGPAPRDAAAKTAWVDKIKADLADKMNPQALKNYDTIIFANTTGVLPLPDKAAFLDWIKSGKGFVAIHSGSDTFHDPKGGIDPYIEMLGGEFRTHEAQVTVECLNMDPKHPAAKNFDKSFTLRDEIYQMKNFFREKVHGILTLDKHPNNGMPGDYPISWCKQYGKGRVFYTSLGHREDVWEPEWKAGRRENAPEIAVAYQKHITGGIRWALGLEKGDAKPQSTKAALSRQEMKEGFRPLFDGTDLAGWRFRDATGVKSWSAQNGMLVNTVAPGGHGVDLITAETFTNFTVRYEYMIPKGSNSGFYLRGRHEIQILDDYDAGKPSLGGNGAIYQHTAPSEFVSRKPGQWQEVEATMIGKKVTVILNGKKIHDNVTVDRATGSELDNKVNEPGPFFLQGDHGAIAFRNIRVKTLK